MPTNNHGSCRHCGFDFNGEMIYDYFLKEYHGDKEKAKETASQYGATENLGRFGRQVFVTDHLENYTKQRRYIICPQCKEEQ